MSLNVTRWAFKGNSSGVCIECRNSVKHKHVCSRSEDIMLLNVRRLLSKCYSCKCLVDHPDRMKDAVIAKLANQAADFYGDAFKQCHCKDSVPKVWTHNRRYTLS